ncbi:MAG: DUF4136 domain-containing protein [Bacteroidota bacterium]
MNRLLLPVLVIIIGCSPPTITSNCDNSIDFKKYTTFCVVDVQEDENPVYPEYDNYDNRVLIEQAIISELTNMGYKKLDRTSDLIVDFDIVITEKVDPRVDSAVIYKPWVDTKIDSFNYTEGLLVIRIVDRKEKRLVWQGSMSGILNRKPQQFDNRIKTYITKLFDTLSCRM